jgi:nucleotidyltransferase substrate binding protein (TIGR01987 family)
MSTDIPLLTDFEKAVARLKEVLDLKKTDVIRDSAIKRFELCFDLAWKCIQAYARREGLDCQSPRACLKTAFQLGLIDYEDDWLKMLDDRNLSVHTYKEKYAEEIFSRIKHYSEMFERLLTKIFI